MRIKLITSTIIMLLAISASAQVQQGLVKTLGRPNKPGHPLSGVTIRVKTVHNAIVSDSKGKFSFVIPGLKNGEGYYISSISKNDYELNEKEVLGRQLPFSSSVPVQIVMVSKKQLERDRQRIELNAYEKAEKNYQRQKKAWEDSLNTSTITIKKYREIIDALDVDFEKYTGLVGKMSDYYAHIDYDALEEQDKQIAYLIENGELEKADSILQSLIDINTVVSENRAAREELDLRRETERRLKEQNDEAERKLRKKTETDAFRLYQLFSSALMQMDFKNASTYISLRAELDTLNYEWQLDAGDFFYDYISDFQKALDYYMRAHEASTLQYGEYSGEVAMCLHSFSNIYKSLGMTDKAIEYLHKANEMRMKVYGEESPDVAKTNISMGYLYMDLRQLNKASEFLDKALAILRVPDVNDPKSLASCYDAFGSLFYEQNKFRESVEFYKKALQIYQKEYGEASHWVASCYSNLIAPYVFLNMTDSTVYYFENSFDIFKNIYPQVHKSLAILYGNVGYAYQKKGDYRLALDYYKKALDISREIFGEFSASVSRYNYVISMLYEEIQDFRKALEYSGKYLSFMIQTRDKDDKYIIGVMNNMYILYHQLLQQPHEMSDEKDYSTFSIDKTFILSVTANSAASEKGLKGDFYILELSDWDIEDRVSFADINQALGNGPRDILLMSATDGVISKLHFEGKMGCPILYRIVGKEKKQEILQKYHDWKEANQ